MNRFPTEPAAARGDKAKTRRIRQFNLGWKKLRDTRHRQRAELERQINTATNEVLGERQPLVIATGDP